MLSLSSSDVMAFDFIIIMIIIITKLAPLAYYSHMLHLGKMYTGGAKFIACHFELSIAFV